MHIVLVHVHVAPEHVAAFIDAINVNAAASRREPGVVRFDVLQQQDDPSRFALVEVYRDQAAAAAHKTTTHYLSWRDAVATWMAEPRAGASYRNLSPDDSAW